jgi:hypothetical protein
MVSTSTEYRHRMLQAPPRIKASSLYLQHRRNKQQKQADPCTSDHSTTSRLFDSVILQDNNDLPTMPESNDIPETFAQDLVNSTMSKVDQTWRHVPSLDDSDVDEGSDGDISMIEDDAVSDDGLSDIECLGLDWLGESWERALADLGKFSCCIAYWLTMSMLCRQ